MKKIFICSPLKGDMEENMRRAREYSREVILAGHMPITPHIYFTQFLDDNKLEERELGISMGRELLEICDEMWIYGEPSEGMRGDIKQFKGKKIKKL